MLRALLLLATACAPASGVEPMRRELSAIRTELGKARQEVADLRRDLEEVRQTRSKLATAHYALEPRFADEADLIPTEVEVGHRFTLDDAAWRAITDPERWLRRGYPRAIRRYPDVALRLTDVYTNSLEHRLGLRTGDVLRYLNDEPVQDLADLGTARSPLAAAASHGTFRWVVQRRGTSYLLVWERAADAAARSAAPTPEPSRSEP